MKRNMLILPAALILICLAAQSKAELITAAPSYSVVELNFEVRDLNNRGQAVGSKDGQAILWDAESGATTLGPGEAWGINEFGRVVGSEGQNGWLWDPVFGLQFIDDLLNPRAINDLGQVVGEPNSIPSLNGGYLWDPVFGFTSITNIGEGGEQNQPLDLNNRGEVVGVRQSGEPQPIYWSLGDSESQLLYGPDGSIVAGSATGINNSGSISAALLLSSNLSDDVGCNLRFCRQAGLYKDFSVELITPGQALAVNNLDWVVGLSYFENFESFAFLWSREFGVINLNERSGGSNFRLASSVNDSGWIVADNRFLLIPVQVAEPSSFTLFVLGLALIFFLTRLRQYDTRMRQQRQLT